MRLSTLTVFTSASLLALSAGLIGCASSDSGDAEQAMAPTAVESASHDAGAPIEASGAVLRVNGMSCPKCANNITLKLKELPSVQEVLINMGIGEVIVAFGEGTHPSRDQLASAIDSAGFTLESITVR
jgi:copper chaperone CopZ